MKNLLKIIKKKNNNIFFLKKGYKINIKIKDKINNKIYELDGKILKIKGKYNKILKIGKKIKGIYTKITILLDSPSIIFYKI